MESNTSWTVKIKVKNHCNMLQTKTFMSHNICIFCCTTKLLTYLLIWYVARHHFDACDIPFFAYDKLMHSCDVKTMIYHFLNMVVTSKLLYIVFEHGWETVFYHMYTVKVYYKYIYIIHIYIYITTKTQVLITLSKAIEQFC